MCFERGGVIRTENCIQRRVSLFLLLSRKQHVCSLQQLSEYTAVGMNTYKRLTEIQEKYFHISFCEYTLKDKLTVISKLTS